MNMKHKYITDRHQQTGAVLIVSLMIMLVMTMIGVSALSGTSLEEKMAHNFQQSMIVFQGAETAIEKIVIAGDPGGAGVFDNPFYNVANDPLVTSLSAGIDDVSTVVNYTTADLDPNNYIKMSLPVPVLPKRIQTTLTCRLLNVQHPVPVDCIYTLCSV